MVNYDKNRNKVGGFLMYTDNKKVLKLVEFDKNDVLGFLHQLAGIMMNRKLELFCHLVKYTDIKMLWGKLFRVLQ